jgi:very-short-patch-repair endonuclease
MGIIIIVFILVIIVIALIVAKEDDLKEENLTHDSQIDPVNIESFESTPKYYPIVLKSKHPHNFELTTINHRTDKGIMEDYFFDYASPIFKGNFSNLIQIKIGGSMFTPDFYFLDQFGNHLIVEIDEPYTMDENQNLIPIHTIGMNQIKNNLLLGNGLNLIRFSEEQVVKYPEKCVEIIQNFIAGKDSIALMPEIDCWGINQAKQMINSKYRDTYLPFPLLISGRTNNEITFRSLKISRLHFFNVKGEPYVKFNVVDSCYEKQKNEDCSSELWIKETLFDELLITANFDSTLRQFNIDKQRFLLLNIITYCRIEGLFTKNNHYFNVHRNNKIHIVISPERLVNLTSFLQNNEDIINENF